jgi:hypothetical protein
LLLPALAFGIGAPGAFQGTALEEYYCAYAGTVVQAEFLDVENKTFALSSFHFSCLFHL